MPPLGPNQLTCLHCTSPVLGQVRPTLVGQLAAYVALCIQLPYAKVVKLEIVNIACPHLYPSK